MKCFTYQLNANGEGPAGRLPVDAVTGFYKDGIYYGAAVIDDLSGLADWRATEISTSQFNQALTTDPTTPALVAIEPAVRKSYAEKLKAVVVPYTAEERETWYVQVQEARAYLADPNAVVPLISTIASARGMQIGDIANNIISKDEQYRVAVGQILGQQQEVIKQIWTV